MVRCGILLKSRDLSVVPGLGYETGLICALTQRSRNNTARLCFGKNIHTASSVVLESARFVSYCFRYLFLLSCAVSATMSKERGNAVVDGGRNEIEQAGIRETTVDRGASVAVLAMADNRLRPKTLRVHVGM